ncbi:hypothetical protein SLA2020_370080 [Shorea laevis]
MVIKIFLQKSTIGVKEVTNNGATKRQLFNINQLLAKEQDEELNGSGDKEEAIVTGASLEQQASNSLLRDFPIKQIAKSVKKEGHGFWKKWKRLGRNLIQSPSKKMERKGKRKSIPKVLGDGRASKVRFDGSSIALAMQVDAVSSIC